MQFGTPMDRYIYLDIREIAKWTFTEFVPHAKANLKIGKMQILWYVTHFEKKNYYP